MIVVVVIRRQQNGKSTRFGQVGFSLVGCLSQHQLRCPHVSITAQQRSRRDQTKLSHSIRRSWMDMEFKLGKKPSRLLWASRLLEGNPDCAA